ncbi:Hypothetical protein NCDO2118_0308 [Lactococcus lactis subsp. lactis NCDO 2118]|uniref:Uncharacterized protein n=1 Tax=Lactococcus lactis subsp. lactis NCDO 2118 TaxID=1117941 RepID=A0ABC8A3K0_LACLL|nr:Hypothetical protein NCDO2118_0308 [Lactococcus lactis subsp. lactis NCDO 2118]
MSVPYFVKCKRGDTSYTVGMTRIVRLVSLVPPSLAFWGVKSKLTASRQPCNHTLTPYATLGAMLTFLHFFKKSIAFKTQ